MNPQDIKDPLKNFLEAYFSLVFDMQKNDKDIVIEIVINSGRIQSSLALDQIAELLLLSKFPWQRIEELSNHKFNNEEECKEWLKQIAEYFKEYLRGKEAS